MVYLDEILSRKDLVDMLDKGYVRTQNHPTGYLTIFNYTNKAQYDNEWNDVTEQTRGLIIDPYMEEVVARPFRKFFNWEQLPPTVQADLLNRPVETYMKWDGSLGILYGLHTGESAIATRGSFTSPQAQHATELLRTRYAEFEPIGGLTYLFEIIYPENRIVLDYQGMDDLVLLAVIDTETGDTLPSGTYDWPGPINRPVEFMSLKDVLAAPQVENQEGFVFHFPSTGQRVKFKFGDYIRLHRILTNVSTLSVWDALRSGLGIEAFIDRVPDEFYDWVKTTASTIQDGFDRVESEAKVEFEWFMKRIARPEWDTKARRKEFALAIAGHAFQPIFFAMYDGLPYAHRIWKTLRPEHEKPVWTRGEDAA